MGDTIVRTSAGPEEYGPKATRIVSGDVWIPMRFDEASASRTTHPDDDAAILTNISVSGDVNSCRIEDVAADVGSGTDADAACFLFPVYDSNTGEQMTFNQTFKIVLQLRVTSNPGIEDNDCFILLGLTTGTNLEARHLSPGIIYNHANNPRVLINTPAGGRSQSNVVDIEKVCGTIRTNHPSDAQAIDAYRAVGYDSDGIMPNNGNRHGRSTSNQFLESGGMPGSRLASPVFACIVVGRTHAGAGSKNFSFTAYYCCSPPFTYEGSNTLKPTPA